MANSRPTSSAGSNTGSIARAFAGQRVALVRYTARLLNSDASRAEFVVQAALDDLLASPPDDPASDEAEQCFAACHQQAHAIARPEDRTKLFAEAPPGPAQTGAEDHTALLRQIERLTPKQQEVVRLKFQNGFGHAAIARIVDLPRDKVGALMHTAIARLREDDSSQIPVADSRITARALDEQTEPERDAFARALREDPALEEKVTAVRTFAARIEEALAIESGTRAPRRPAQGTRKKLRWFGLPVFWFVAGGALALGIGAFFFFRAPRENSNRSAQFAGDFKLRPAAWQEQPPADSEKTPAHVSTPASDSSTPSSTPTRGRKEEIEHDSAAPAPIASASLRHRPARSTTRVADDGPTTGEKLNGEAPAMGAPDVAAAIAGTPAPRGAVDTGVQKARPSKTPAVEKKPEKVSPDVDEKADDARKGDDPAPADSRGEAPRPARLATKGPGALGGSDFRAPSENPISALPSDTDMASVAGLMKTLGAGQQPAASAVRVEELLNYFPTSDVAPKDADAFSASVESAEAPWDSAHRLVRVGLKGRQAPPAPRSRANLVFLLDVSGSMDWPSRLPLVQESMRLLLQRLRPDDRVAIVTYAGESQLMLPSTPVSESPRIRHVLAALHPGGQTNGGAGIQLAYTIAKAGFVEGGANRVILCTDGDFNVGVTDPETLTALAAEQAKAHISLSVFGFGRGYRIDARLEALAAQGQGRSGYVSTRREAERALAEEVDGLFAPIARDVKLEVAFNPAVVAGYRLIGYERENQPASEGIVRTTVTNVVGSGHTLTALYEIVPVAGAANSVARRDPWLTFKVDYQDPAGPARHVLAFPLGNPGGHFSEASGEFKFAAAVAAFGMILQNSPAKGTSTLRHVAEWAEAGRGDDPGGYRSEFIELVKAAQKLEP